MFSIDADQMVCYLKDVLIGHKSPNGIQSDKWKHKDGVWTKPGLLVELDLRLTDYAPVNKGEESRSRVGRVFFLMCGNTNVFAYTHQGGYRYRTELPWESFTNISNHDTCWRDAIRSFLSRLYAKWSEELEEEGSRYLDLTQHCFVGFGTSHHLCTVSYTDDEERNREYGNWNKVARVDF